MEKLKDSINWHQKQQSESVNTVSRMKEEVSKLTSEVFNLQQINKGMFVENDAKSEALRQRESKEKQQLL